MKKQKNILTLSFLTAMFCTIASVDAEAQTYSMMFSGTGRDDIDRMKIMIDNPTNSLPGSPADIGNTDFTIDFWMKAKKEDNTTGTASCASGYNWIYGNIIIDRDRYSQPRAYGISVAGGKIMFGVKNGAERTICSKTNVLNNAWHHIAVQRRLSDGMLQLFVDGKLEAQAKGPKGDISYPDNGVPGNYCNGSCSFSDPYLVFGAEKHDAGSDFPSYKGLLDEVRLSNVLRYSSAFQRPYAPHQPDANTVGFYKFDEGQGIAVKDASGRTSALSNDGVVKYNAGQTAPSWSRDTPFGSQ